MVVDTVAKLILSPLVEFLKTQALEIAAKKAGEKTASLAWNQVFDSLKKQSDEILAGVKALRQKDAKAALNFYEMAIKVKSMRDENMKSAYDRAIIGKDVLDDPVLKIQSYSVLLLAGTYLHSTKKLEDVSEEKRDKESLECQNDFMRTVFGWMRDDTNLLKAIEKALKSTFYLTDTQNALLKEVFNFRMQIVQICETGVISDPQIIMFWAIETNRYGYHYIHLTPPNILGECNKSDDKYEYFYFSGDMDKNKILLLHLAMNILKKTIDASGENVTRTYYHYKEVFENGKELCYDFIAFICKV